MSEQSGFIKRKFPHRVWLVLPIVVFALVSFTTSFVVSRTNGLALSSISSLAVSCI